MDRVSRFLNSKQANNSLPAVQDGTLVSIEADASSPALSPGHGHSSDKLPLH